MEQVRQRSAANRFLMPLDLASLTSAHFEPLLKSSFELKLGEKPPVPLELIEIRRLGHRRQEAAKEPFALTFRGQSGWRLAQGIYAVNHPEMGPLEIFITQVGDAQEGSLFEAVFS